MNVALRNRNTLSPKNGASPQRNMPELSPLHPRPSPFFNGDKAADSIAASDQGEARDLKIRADAWSKHNELVAEGVTNPTGSTYWARLFAYGTGQPRIFDNLLMPDEHIYERLVTMWGAMSVYGSLVGVAAFESGMPEQDSADRNGYYHTSCSLMITASIFLMIPVCQLTVLTMCLQSVPKHRLRYVVMDHKITMVLSGPLHLVGTQIFFAGVVCRFFSLELPNSILLTYLIPVIAAFGGCWFFCLHTMARCFNWCLLPGAWEYALKMNGDGEEVGVKNASQGGIAPSLSAKAKIYAE